MAKEIERKFLVLNQSYKEKAEVAIDIRQGYLSRDPKRTVRVRIKDDKAFLTVKGLTKGCVRDEWEYEVPYEDAIDMLESIAIPPVISKTRYIVKHDQFVWEIDEFHGSHQGLVIAEVELPTLKTVLDNVPDFVGKEVTGDSRYYNSNL